MANNLHISYDLINPGQNYDKIIEKIKSLGNTCVKIHKSFWYVSSKYSAQEAKDILVKVIDHNDTVYVVNASNNSASWNNLANGKEIISSWNN